MPQHTREQDEVTTKETAKPRQVTESKASKKQVKPNVTKKQLQKALEEAKTDLEKLKTQLAYVQAHHENYVKSMEKHQSQIRLQANRDLLLGLLPILDDLERAQVMVPQIEVNTPFIEGLNMLVENLKSTLDNAGVKPIKCEGHPFDPLRHEAVVREETSDVAPNTVIEELRKGYLLKGTLLRPSMVRIAIAPVPTDVIEEKPVKEIKTKKSSKPK